MAKYKKEIVYNSRRRLIRPRKIFGLSKQKRRKESRWKLLSSISKPRVIWILGQRKIDFVPSVFRSTGRDFVSHGRGAKHIKIYPVFLGVHHLTVRHLHEIIFIGK